MTNFPYNTWGRRKKWWDFGNPVVIPSIWVSYPRLYPCIALRSRGRLGDWWIFKSYHTFNVVAKMYYPENPRTNKQQAWRIGMYDAIKNWRAMDEAAHQYYNALIAPKTFDGFRRYVKMYLRKFIPMIIYWDTLEKNAGDVSRLPDYMASGYLPSVHFARNIYWSGHPKGSGQNLRIPDYIQSEDFGGVGRIYPANQYPASSPYGAIRYRTDLKKFMGFKENSGWGEIGGGVSVDFLSFQIFN